MNNAPFLRRSAVAVLLCLLFLARSAQAGVAESIAAGRAGLHAHNLVQARAGFDAAVAADPANAEANVLDALVKFLQIETDPAAQGLLTKLGVSKTGRDLFHWKAKFPQKFKTTLTSDNFEQFANLIVLPKLQGIEDQLKVAQSGFLTSLGADETGGQPVTLDYGDVLLLQSEVIALTSAIQLLDGYETNVRLGDLGTWLSNNAMTMQNLLATYPDLLKLTPAKEGTLQGAPGVIAAIATFAKAFTRYEMASDFIRARADSTGRLFVLEPDQAPAEAAYRTKFAKVKDSLTGQLAFDTRTQVFAGPFATAPKDLRSVLPTFENNHAKSFPDLTFAGVLPNSGQPWADRVTAFFANVSIGLDQLFRHRDDPIAPVLKVTFPKPNQAVTYTTADSVTFTGTATDNKGVTSVEISPRRGPAKGEHIPATLSGTGTAVTWTAIVPAQPGTNIVRVEARDAQGNKSAKTVITYNFVKYAKITVTKDGAGQVAGKVAAGGRLVIGTSTTLTATPATGMLFKEWAISEAGHGSYTDERAKLTLSPEGDTTVIARFIVSPYTARAGVFNSTLTAFVGDPDTGDGMNVDRGFFSLKLTKTGGFTGKITIGRVAVPIQGKFDSRGNFQTSIGKGAARRIVFIGLNFSTDPNGSPANGIDDLFVSISDPNDPADSGLTGFTTGGVPTGLAKEYTSTIKLFGGPADLRDPSQLVVTPGLNGAVRIAGTMPDGNTVSTGSTLQISREYDYDDDGNITGHHDYPQVPAYTPVKPGSSLLSGFIALDAQDPFGSDLHWFHQGISGSDHPEEFNLSLSVQTAVTKP